MGLVIVPTAAARTTNKRPENLPENAAVSEPQPVFKAVFF
jgi:hypothetical protein